MTFERLLALVTALVLSAGLFITACGDDDDDDNDTAGDDDAADDDAADDDAGDDDNDTAGNCTIEDLCTPVSECGFGFTYDDCVATFLDSCSSADAAAVYLDCMCYAIEQYGDTGDCATFTDAEAGCWEAAGC
jgi:hypothetical protein